MNNNPFSKKTFSFLLIPFLAILFLLFAKFTTGIRPDHYLLVAIIITFYYISSFTRRLITGLAIIIVYWIIFDSMKACPNWAFNDVDIQPLYDFEKKLFGIIINGDTLVPNEYFLLHTSVAADIICGIFYLGWMPLPLLFAFYLYFKNKNLFLRFCMAFFIVNIFGFIIYYAHPAAPPWYYLEHGNLLDVNTKSNAAGLLRFDQFFGINLFENLYSKGSNVFAAMPSLHASYPLIGLFYAFKQPLKWMRVVFAVVMCGIWFAAIYLTHHYILDVIAGTNSNSGSIFRI